MPEIEIGGDIAGDALTDDEAYDLPLERRIFNIWVAYFNELEVIALSSISPRGERAGMTTRQDDFAFNELALTVDGTSLLGRTQAELLRAMEDAARNEGPDTVKRIRQEIIDSGFPPDIIDSYLREMVVVDDFIDIQAIEFLEDETIALTNKKANDVFQEVRGVVSKSIAAGGNFDDTASAIRGIAAFESPKRAALVARTETVRAVNAGRVAGFRRNSSILKGYKHSTRKDDVTGPIDFQLDGGTYTLQGVPTNDISIRFPGEVIPIHPSCVLPRTPLSGSFLVGLKSYYDGPALEIRSRSGMVLSVTPNHPVMTSDGWVAAGSLKNGDELFHHKSGVIPGLETDILQSPHDSDSPVMAEEVFNMLSRLVGSETVPTTPEDLHGDAVGGDGYVDVVGPVRKLRHDFVSMHSDDAGDVLLDVGDSAAACLSGQSGLDLLSLGLLSSRGCLPSGPALTPDLLGVLLHGVPLDPLLLGGGSDVDALLLESSIERGSVDSCDVLQFVEAHPGLVELDPIVDVTPITFSGHVYDFQTSTGTYWANNLLVHNCRCSYVPTLKDPSEVDFLQESPV